MSFIYTKPFTANSLDSLYAKRQHNWYYLTYLSVLSGLFFWLAWPPNLFAPLLFVVLTPLLLIARHIEQCNTNYPGKLFYRYAYLSVFLWNITTTWWVAHSTVAGTFFMFLFNTFYMSLPLMLFQFTARHLSKPLGYIALIFYWISMESIHLQWQFSFPWLNLGNGFACWPEWVQWYEFTGTSGGTFWILTSNILVFITLTHKEKKIKRLFGAIIVCWTTLPILYSYYTYWHYQEHGKEVEVVVMQPNINPYTNELLDAKKIYTAPERVEHFIQLSKDSITEKTQFLVWPETSVYDGDAYRVFNEESLHLNPVIRRLVDFKQLYPQLSIVAGLNSVVCHGNRPITKTAHFNSSYGYYDVFNTALFVDDQGRLATYHKSRLVPGVERVPYIYNLKIPKILVPDGFSNNIKSLGVQACPSVFFNKEGIGSAPIVCYESIYGDYLTEFIRMGASLIFAIAIDSWWGNTPGYKQHFHYTRLRAIENRRSVARSALKGISAFINQRGDIISTTQYEDTAVLRHVLQANTQLTFYALHSYVFAKVSLGSSLFFIIHCAYALRKSRRQRRRSSVLVPKS